MNRKQLLSLSRGDPEYRTALKRAKYAPKGQRVKRARNLVLFVAERLAASSGKGR